MNTRIALYVEELTIRVVFPQVSPRRRWSS